MDANTQTFQQTRITLTSWYVGILAVILFAFSVVLYTGEQHDFVRIIARHDFGNRIPRTLSESEQRDVRDQLAAIRTTFIVNLLIVDGIVLLLGGALSYFLAGITLSPIKKTFDTQKLFLADVSHEIRTPLAAIQTATEVSLRSKNKTKEEYKYVLTQVYDEAKRLTKMANDLLFLSRMESGASIHFQEVRLDKIITDTENKIAPLANKKNITITLNIDTHVTVSGDSDSLTQLLMIFLDNAIKYTKNNGTISISLTQKPKPTIVITDTGVGIAKKDIQRIFERFYQVDVSRASSGIGLGLAIAQEIIAMHKAKVTVESMLEKGTTFIITFPA